MVGSIKPETETTFDACEAIFKTASSADWPDLFEATGGFFQKNSFLPAHIVPPLSHGASVVPYIYARKVQDIRWIATGFTSGRQILPRGMEVFSAIWKNWY